MAPESRSHQCEIETLIDPQRLDLCAEAVLLIVDSRLNIDSTINDLLDCIED